MALIRGRWAKWGGALALASLALAPATSADARPRHRGKTVRPAAQAGELPSFGAFTPGAADPRMAAAFARSGLGSSNFSGGAFRFTPSGDASSRRAVTVAVRARGSTRPQQNAHAAAATTTTEGLASQAFSLGASIGWKRFALSGDIAKVEDVALPTSTESADIGLSYAGRRWSGKIDLGAERASSDHAALVGIDQSWSVGLGGSYSLTRKIDLTGGVRYKLQRDQFLALSDNRRDSQAVYLGTTFKF
ncbi:porin [uncultured Sphingomonas sp.]|uniref:porin n=1 Tax=uncultured Sphingomonas sp. TaxID=158754 RepID=UPI0025F4359A|nr:porin [uncultured Sphingomonas sp.]